MFGTILTTARLDLSLERLARRWEASYQPRADGPGWYRRLSEHNRVGIVATANAVESLLHLDRPVPESGAPLQTLVQLQHADGNWSFVSTLADVPVVDATCAAVSALHRACLHVRDVPPEVQRAVTSGLDWLERCANPEGGWGLVPGSAFRPFTTALAVEVLASCGRPHAQPAIAGAQRLLSSRDLAQGYWRDSAGSPSIPLTAQCIIALLSAGHSSQRYESGVERGVAWLLSIGRHTKLWTAGAEAADLEEVEAYINGHLRRIEYGYSGRALAVEAIIQSSNALNPMVLLTVEQMVSDVLADEWTGYAKGRYVEPPSWMLYDVTKTLKHFRDTLPNTTDSLWTNGSRLVTHASHDSRTTRHWQRHRPKVLASIACLALVIAVISSGLLPTPSFTSVLLLIVATLGLDIVAAFIYEATRHYWVGKR